MIDRAKRVVRKRWIGLAAFSLLVAGVYLNNASWTASPTGELIVMSHRGVHQTYPREGLKRDTCTADRIHPPTHAYIENTLPSMRRAIELGADVVELDIHPTTDGAFAVFHDWTIDCRTEGRGETRNQAMTYLKTLDIGHGYTADGGRTFPLRGKGVGMMPTLEEVLTAFPAQRFLVNIKSDDPSEGERLHAYLSARPSLNAGRLDFYGGDKPMARLKALRPSTRVMSKASLKECAKDYGLTGWTGHVPSACRNTVIMVPINWSSLLWGWPNRFLARMQSAGTDVYLGGRLDTNTRSLNAIDDLATLRRTPSGWRGGIDTDKIEVIGPAVRARRAEQGERR